ncbi:MAG TPA: nucleotidyl transferase AbiEii/AbiGii toxin family protein [Steroidobacteraceae bacterium]|jgi:predicted nucleotidyltransferase component of viral defense system
MPKRHLTPTEAFDLRQALHVATLDALMASRRWEPGDLVFQGGTSLHLVHGSPRYSEDLNFLVNSSLNLQSLAKAVEARLEGASWLVPAGAELTVSKAKDARNPHTFVVAIGGPDLIGGVRVKVELWRVKASALTAVKTTVIPVRLVHGAGSGLQTFVPTAELPEIYVDKVFALGARPYLKARDVFDLHWLAAQGVSGLCTLENLRVRLATYPAETATAWLAKAQARRKELASSTSAVAQDLERWLPSAWPLTGVVIPSMVQVAIESLDEGMQIMREIEAKAQSNGS